MDAAEPQSSGQPLPGPSRPAPTTIGRVLLCDPDELLLWSMERFLGRWFEVVPCRTEASAERALHAGGLSACVISDQMPAAAVRHLLRLAAQATPPIRTVVTVLAAADGRPERPAGVARLEKPFALRDLACLLGVPESALTSE